MQKADLEQLESRLQTYINRLENETRRRRLLELYSDFGDVLYLAPASSNINYHNCFPGGYLDHVLRVTDFALVVFNLFKTLGLNVQKISEDSIIFTALNHDLGKLGFPGENNERYIINPVERERIQFGKLYKPNTDIPFMLVPDLGLFLLQKYGIEVSFDEYLAIKLHDGLYEEVNIPYFISKIQGSELKTYLPYILHFADLLAAKRERELFEEDKTNTQIEVKSYISNTIGEADTALSTLMTMFT